MKRAATITEFYHLTPDTEFQLRGQSHVIARQLSANPLTGEAFEAPRTFVECWSYSTLIALYDVRGEAMYEHEDARNMSRTDYGVDYFEAWYTAPGTPNGEYVDAYSGRRGVATIVDHRTDSRVVGADLPAAVRASAERMRARAAEYRRIVEDPAGLRDKASAYNAAIDAVRAAYAGFTTAERDLLGIAYPDVARLRI